MSVVTRRYLYQGPPLQEVRDQTDPDLTLTPTAFKVSFDATFDDAVAEIKAVDMAMASSGLVPDPGADTKTPPAFQLVSPNGTSWNLLVDDTGVLSTIKAI